MRASRYGASFPRTRCSRGAGPRLSQEPEPEGERAASRVDHGVTEHHGSRRRAGQHRPRLPRLDQRVPDRRVLQHRTQVEHRSARQVQETSGPDHPRVRLVLSVAAPEHHASFDRGPQGGKVRSGRLYRPLRVPVCGGSGQDQHLTGARGFQQLRVEVLASRCPLRTPDQGEPARPAPVARSRPPDLMSAAPNWPEPNAPVLAGSAGSAGSAGGGS